MDIKYSIIIPTLNQSAKLNQCLFHLTELSFDHDLFEVLVIDNGSTDDTKNVSLLFQNKIKNLRYLFCESPGLMAARHMGCDAAHGNILCYLDDDSMVTKDWMLGIEESFQDENTVIAGGPCIPKYEVEPPDWVEYFWGKTEHGRCHAFLSLVDFGNEKLMMHPCYVFGCNYQIRRKIFYEYGGTCPDYYPENYRQYQGDGESALALKLFNAGFKALYNPKARIDHLIPTSRLTIDYFCWRRFFNGIHASYRRVRQQYGLDGFKKPVSLIAHQIILKIRRPLGRIKRGTVGMIRRLINSNACVPRGNLYSLRQEPPEIVSIRKQIEKSYHEGYAFHQRMLNRDHRLREWVLRENYLGENGKLPIGAR